MYTDYSTAILSHKHIIDSSTGIFSHKLASTRSPICSHIGRAKSRRSLWIFLADICSCVNNANVCITFFEASLRTPLAVSFCTPKIASWSGAGVEFNPRSPPISDSSSAISGCDCKKRLKTTLQACLATLLFQHKLQKQIRDMEYLRPLPLLPLSSVTPQSGQQHQVASPRR